MVRAEALARKQAAKDFAQRWAGRGYEKGETSKFWLELLRDVVGMEDVFTNVRFEDKTVDRGFIDVTIRDAKTVIEQKSFGVDLDKPERRQGVLVTPFEQAKRYADSLRNSERPDTIIVSNFHEFRIHDLDVENPGQHYERFTLDELPEQLHLLDFLIDPQLQRRRREEKVSLDAGMLIGQLYEMVRERYIDPDSAESMHSLNVLCVRLVFLLFAEDAGLFKKDSFYRYLKHIPADRARPAIKDLFAWLNTPVGQRDPYASAALKEFPYVNGGLFETEVEVPTLTPEIVDFLLDEVSQGTDWSQISPTVFGGVFESTLNPETRRSGGMHYTSPENIHKVIGPLFLDALKAELEGIFTDDSLGERARHNRLRTFHDKIAGLAFFDPACGSGNFLTETYIQLRKLENKILSEIQRHQGMLAVTEETTPLKISLRQFHGIEINDFAVNVASTALWIAELQANAEAQSIVYSTIMDLPLHESAHIVHGNALTLPWEDVLDPSECDYIIGNPPFVGKLSEEQHAERALWFGKEAGRIDYVGSWFKAAALYMKDTACKTAMVSTNSITQGVQVTPLWKPLMKDGLVIIFAHRTFNWASESRDAAHVHVVIIGFSYRDEGPKWLWDYSTGEAVRSPAEHINAYLTDGPNMFVEQRSTPLDPTAPILKNGTKPTGKGLVFTQEDHAAIVAASPDARRLFRPFVGAIEFVKSTHRYVLWATEEDLPLIATAPPLIERLEEVRTQRAKSTLKSTRELADAPWRPYYIGDPGGDPYLVIPRVTSADRRYFPIGFFDDETIPSDSCFFMSHASTYEFAVMTSRAHNAWLEQIGGRLKSDTRYSNQLVYNTFIWPRVADDERARISDLAQTVLYERARLTNDHGVSLEQMYKPAKEIFYPALFKAHKALDEAVEAAYGLPVGVEEKDIVAKLFELYVEAMKA